MARQTAAITVLFCCLVVAGPARAGVYRLTFESLLPELGQQIPSYSDQGFTLADATDFSVVGPRAPSYAGMVGLAPGTRGRRGGGIG